MILRPKSRKIYCYADETGQDTQGRLFIVVAIVVSAERQALIDQLEEMEEKSGGRRRQPWSKKDRKRQERYLDLVSSAALLQSKVYYRTYKHGQDYDRLTAAAIIQAIQAAWPADLNRVHATIVIDGLNAAARRIVRQSVLASGIRIDKIRGERDESSPILRLADVMARLVRRATENHWEDRARVQKYRRDRILTEL